VMGPSGSGKSTLLNMIAGRDLHADAVHRGRGITVIAFGDVLESYQRIHARQAGHRSNTRGGHWSAAVAGASGRGIRLPAVG